MSFNLLLDIPRDVLVCELLLYLPVDDILSLSRVNKQLHTAIDNPLTWEGLYKAHCYPDTFLSDVEKFEWKQRVWYYEKVGRCDEDGVTQQCLDCDKFICLKHYTSAMSRYTEQELAMLEEKSISLNKIRLRVLCIACAYNRRMFIFHSVLGMDPNKDNDIACMTTTFYCFFQMGAGKDFLCFSHLPKEKV